MCHFKTISMRIIDEDVGVFKNRTNKLINKIQSKSIGNTKVHFTKLPINLKEYSQ